MDFGHMLVALMSPDNAARSAAETQYRGQCEAAPDSVAGCLTDCLLLHPDPGLRSFAGVLLRRLLDQSASRLTPQTTAAMRAKIVDAWTREDSPLFLRRLNHIMAQSAARGDWNELLPFVLTASMKMPTTGKIAALEIVEILSEYSPDQIFANISILGNYLGGLITSHESKVAVACARATSACIVAIDDDVARNSFKPALDPIVSVIGAAIREGLESEAVAIIEHLVSVAQMQPLFFKGPLDNLIRAMVAMVNSTSLEFNTRAIAMELMVTICETAPALARRCVPLMEGLLPSAMQLVLEHEVEDADWVALRYGEESIDENCLVGEEAVERVAAGLGGKTVLPLVLPLVQTFATNNQWFYRRAAVCALSRLAEGCTKLFETHLPASCDFLLAALHDSSFRVMYEAEQAIGELALLYPDSSSVFVARFMGRLVEVLGDPQVCERVRCHAASAMINLCNPDNTAAEELQTHLESILRTIVACLQSSSADLQSPCLVLLG